MNTTPTPAKDDRSAAGQAQRLSEGSSDIRAVSLEDHEFVGEWLGARLEEAGFEHLTNVSDPEQLVPEVRRLDANMAILDVTVPGADPFAAASELSGSGSGVRVVFLSASAARHHIVAAIRAGAVGFFSKADDPADFIAGLRAISKGRLAFGSLVIESVPALEDVNDQPFRTMGEVDLEANSRLETLTEREREVLALIGQGMSRTEISETLHRSPKTIDKHRGSLMDKLDIRDRARLVLFAVREGVVDPNQQ